MMLFCEHNNTHMPQTIHYFGFGVNCSGEVLCELLGRNPKGFDAVLLDYELCVQKWSELPRRVQKIVEKVWAPTLRSYFIRPRRGKKVEGRVWLVTKEERKLIEEWEFWHTPVHATVDKKGGGKIRAETEMLRNYKIGTVVDGTKYPLFLNGKSNHIRVARHVRGLYLRTRKHS